MPEVDDKLVEDVDVCVCLFTLKPRSLVGCISL